MEEFFHIKDEPGKNVTQDNPTTFQKLQKLIAQKINRLYVTNIPDNSIQEMQPIFVRTYGPIAYATAIALFIFFAYLSYSSNINQNYISLTYDRVHCSTVPIKVTDSYYADLNGNWIGSSGFRYSNALYQLDLNGFSISDISQYEEMMQAFQADILRIGNMAKSMNLAFNLLLWTAYNRYYSLDSRSLVRSPSDSMKGGLQQFQMTGDAKQVFDLKYQAIRVMSFAGYCPIIPSTSYSRESGIISGSISALDFMSDPVCSGAFDPGLLGWDKNFDGYNFSLGMDVQSFTIAMAVNLGYISLETLETAENQYDPIVLLTGHTHIPNVTYSIGQYFDLRYASMSPIICIQNLTQAPPNYLTVLCTVKLRLGSEFYALPIFNTRQIGDPDRPESYLPCRCEAQFFPVCDDWYFISGILFYGNLAMLVSFQLMFAQYLTVIGKYPSYHAFNVAMSPAVYWAVAIDTLSNTVDQEDFNAKLFHEVLQPCYGTIPEVGMNVSCSILAVHSYDFGDRSFPLSDYHFVMSDGSCRDSFSIPRQSCQSATLISSLGVAAGNMSIALPIALAVLLPLVYLLLRCMDKVPMEDVYTEEEEATATRMIAGMLLRLRDKRAAGLLHDGIVAAWYAELTDVAKASLYQELMHPTSPSATTSNNEDVCSSHSYSASAQDDLE
eukprot:gene23579-30573_t